MRILALALLLAGCFDPQETDGVLECGAPPDVCPPDFVCADGHCWRDQATPDAPVVVPTPDAPIVETIPDARPAVPDARPALPDARPVVPDAHIPACSDGIDNDCDGLTDWPFDPGCSSPDDDDEHGTLECDDGMDNDHDGKSDYHKPGSSCGPGDSKCKNVFDHEH